MMTMKMFARKFESIPAITSWYLSDISESKGRQELFTRQSPQRLKVLREHALIESAVSSNRIEGVEADKSRIGTILFGKPALKDRDEEEISGYRQALALIHDQKEKLPVSEKTILKLHKLARGKIWDAGKYKEKDGDIIEKYPDGQARIRFKTVSAIDTPASMKEMLELYNAAINASKIHPFIIVAAFNLDFLCIHPFRDGNGRVSRLLLLLQCYHYGIDVGRYISLERIIEQNKERYYETLELSSKGWHEGKHDPWPYINYLFSILRLSCQEFEQRLGELQIPKGEKTRIVLQSIDNFNGTFSVSELQNKCPNVSIDMIRRIMKKLRSENMIECLGRGQNARWQKTDKWQLGNVDLYG
jgi:Fic family protein